MEEKKNPNELSREPIAEELPTDTGSTEKKYIIDAIEEPPELDPNNPHFDEDLYKQFILQDGLTGATSYDFQNVQRRAAEIMGKIHDLYSPEQVAHIVDEMRLHSLTEIENGVFSSAFLVSNRLEKIQPHIDKIREILTSPEFMQSVIANVATSLSELSPEELDALDTPQEEPEEDKNQITFFPEEPEEDQKPKRKNTKKQEILQQAVQDTLHDYILQNNSTNTLTKFNSKDATIDSITGTAKFQRGNFILTIPNYTSLAGLKTSTWQLLDALFMKFTADPRKEKTTRLTLDEYMQLRKLKKRQTAKEQAIADMDILRSAGITLEELRGKEKVSYRFVNLAQSGSVEKNGNITIKWTEEVHTNLLNAPVMYYPRQLQEVNPRLNPNAYYMGRKAAEFKNMNALHHNAGDIISVKTLLESAPAIPSYEEVAETDRAFTRRIIDVFERDLTALGDTFTWEYCHRNGKPLTEEELNDFNYNTFISCNVKLNWLDYPNQNKRKETLEAKIEKAKADQDAGKKKRGRPRKDTGKEGK